MVKVKVGLALLAAAAWVPAWSQSADGVTRAASGLRIAAEYPRPAVSPLGDVAREIDDPHTGDQWMLMRDPVHPGGPGRLVLVQGAGTRLASAGKRDETQPDARIAKRAPSLPVIHAGDTLVVEEHTAVVEARLEAMALSPAVEGAVFKVRLKIGGKVVRAIAVSAERAVFAPQDEAQP